jgi:hypothetical protein
VSGTRALTDFDSEGHLKGRAKDCEAQRARELKLGVGEGEAARQGGSGEASSSQTPARYGVVGVASRRHTVERRGSGATAHTQCLTLAAVMVRSMINLSTLKMSLSFMPSLFVSMPMLRREMDAVGTVGPRGGGVGCCCEPALG